MVDEALKSKVTASFDEGEEKQKMALLSRAQITN